MGRQEEDLVGGQPRARAPGCRECILAQGGASERECFVVRIEIGGEQGIAGKGLVDCRRRTQHRCCALRLAERVERPRETAQALHQIQGWP